MEELAFIQNCFDSYDETFTWYIPDETEKAAIMEQLKKETYDNPHLYVSRYNKDEIIPAARHKTKNDILFIMPDGTCAIAHLLYGKKADDKEDLHFIFFSSAQSAMKFILKQYRIEYLGEKEFVLSQRDKSEIILFLLQFVLFLALPKIRSIVSVVLGIILYALILVDWKESGFNLIRDRKLDHIKVIPLLRYQIAYISIITVMLIIGIPLTVIVGLNL
ncbi:MAG: hypothetical protein IKH71_02470 [Oscillospiraceae bacterium]|nr:hypothetical protein [Oscillospiraceae bacterium]MBR6834678.1 hypothetical protein [Oscillospiraceae bacterium]